MITAIRERRKTQTRRIIKELTEPDKWEYHLERSLPVLGRFTFLYDNHKPYHRETAIIVVKPRYRIGETVYIKEPWAAFLRFDFASDKTGFRVQYKLDNAVEDKFCTVEQAERLNVRRGTAWDSPLFMPSWAARDFIKITDVRPERLQDITEEDAKAEGVPFIHVVPNPQALYPDINGYRRGFVFTWNEINGKTYPYDLNPWVWRICFNLIEDKR